MSKVPFAEYKIGFEKRMKYFMYIDGKEGSTK